MTEIATLRAGAAAAGAFALCLVTGPRVINWLKAKKVREDITKKDSKRLTEIRPRCCLPGEPSMLLGRISKLLGRSTTMPGSSWR